jgi:hypothetical protein
MLEVILGVILGGSITFLLAAMLMAAKQQQILINKSATVKYTNSRGKICEATVCQNVRINDEYAVLKTNGLPMPFVVDVDSLISH